MVIPLFYGYSGRTSSQMSCNSCNISYRRTELQSVSQSNTTLAVDSSQWSRSLIYHLVGLPYGNEFPTTWYPLYIMVFLPTPFQQARFETGLYQTYKKISMPCLSGKEFREKSCLLLDIVQNGGEGVLPESKSFGVIFCGPSFGHCGGKGGRVEPIPKVLG